MKKNILLSLLLLGSVAIDAAKSSHKRHSRKKRNSLTKQKRGCNLTSILRSACAATLLAKCCFETVSILCDRMMQVQESRPVFNQDAPMVLIDADTSKFLGISYPNGTSLFDGSDFAILKVQGSFVFVYEAVPKFALKVGGVEEFNNLVSMYNCISPVSSPMEVVSELTECRKFFVGDSVGALESVVEPVEREMTMTKLDEHEEMQNAASANYCSVKDGVPFCEHNPLVFGLTDIQRVYENSCAIEGGKIVCYEARNKK